LAARWAQRVGLTVGRDAELNGCRLYRMSIQGHFAIGDVDDIGIGTLLTDLTAMNWDRHLRTTNGFRIVEHCAGLYIRDDLTGQGERASRTRACGRDHQRGDEQRAERSCPREVCESTALPASTA